MKSSAKDLKEKAEIAGEIRNHRRKSEMEQDVWYAAYETRIILMKMIMEKDWKNAELVNDALDKLTWAAGNLGDVESVWIHNNMKRETEELLEDVEVTVKEVRKNMRKIK